MPEEDNTVSVTKGKQEFFTIKDLMERWHCGYKAAYNAMHSQAINATKPIGKLLAKRSRVERYESMHEMW